MAFPQVAATNSGNSGANSTTHSISLPSGISSGDLLLVFFSNDGGATASVTTPASGWSSLGGDYSGDSRHYIFYRWADGSEAGTITVTMSSTEGAAWVCYRITGADTTTNPAISTAATGTSNAPNPSTLSPSWGAEDTLWFASYGWDGNVSHSSYPANYTSNQLTARWANLAGTGVAAASRELNNATQDPGAGGLSGSEQWTAYTLAVRPQGTVLRDADDAFAWTETLTHNYVYEDAEDILGLTDEAELAAFNVLAADRLFFFGAYSPGGQDLQHNYIDLSVSNEFNFDSVAGLDYYLELNDYLGFTDRYRTGEMGDNLGLVDVVRRAYLATATDSFAWINHDDPLGPEYAVVRAYKAENGFSFTETVSFGEYHDLYQFFDFDQTADTSGSEYVRPAGGGFVKQHVAFRITGVNCPEKEYTPFIGSSSDETYPEVSTTAPTLGTGVFTLTYPRVSPTSTLVLKSPVFGNTDLVTFNRLDRTTRGGDRLIFSDLDWGSWETLELTIEKICGPTIDEILAFLNASLGKEIGFADWEGRNWRGFISVPQTDVAPQQGGFRLSLTFEGVLV